MIPSNEHTYTICGLHVNVCYFSVIAISFQDKKDFLKKVVALASSTLKQHKNVLPEKYVPLKTTILDKYEIS